MTIASLSPAETATIRCLTPEALLRFLRTIDNGGWQAASSMLRYLQVDDERVERERKFMFARGVRKSEAFGVKRSPNERDYNIGIALTAPTTLP